MLVACFAHPLAGFFLADPAALGRSTPAYAISLGTLLAIRLPLVLGLGGLGPAGVWGALATGEAASALVAWVILRAATRTRPAGSRP